MIESSFGPVMAWFKEGVVAELGQGSFERKGGNFDGAWDAEALALGRGMGAVRCAVAYLHSYEYAQVPQLALLFFFV